MSVCSVAFSLSLLLIISVTLNSPQPDNLMNQMLSHSMYSYSAIQKNTFVCLRFWNHDAFFIGSDFTSAMELLLSLAFFTAHFLKGRAPVIFSDISCRI